MAHRALFPSKYSPRCERKATFGVWPFDLDNDFTLFMYTQNSLGDRRSLIAGFHVSRTGRHARSTKWPKLSITERGKKRRKLTKGVGIGSDGEREM